jgi:hypothetical protein
LVFGNQATSPRYTLIIKRRPFAKTRALQGIPNYLETSHKHPQGLGLAASDHFLGIKHLAFSLLKHRNFFGFLKVAQLILSAMA